MLFNIVALSINCADTSMWNRIRRSYSQFYSCNSVSMLANLRCFSSIDSQKLLRYPRLKHLQDIELPIYASLKQRNPEKALEQFTNLKDEKYKFSSPILTIGFKLMLYYEKPMSWFEISAYLSEVGMYPESGLISLLLEISTKNNATEEILDILGTCLANGYAIRSNAFTNSIEFLLLKIKDYKIIGDMLDLYMEKNYRLEDKILDCLCDKIGSDSSNQMLIGLFKKCLRYLHKKETPISNGEVFEKLCKALVPITGSPVNLAQIKGSACSQCDKNIRTIHLLEEEYNTLSTKLHEIIQEQYNKFQRTKGMRIDIENFQSAFSKFSDSVRADNSQGIIIDGMNASFLINSHRCSRLIKFTDVLQKEYPNCKILIVLRRYILKHTPPDQVETLYKVATICTTQADSRDDLFTVYAALRLKERGLVLTNDKFSELLNDVPIPLHPLLNRWHTKHIINFNLALKCSLKNQLIHAVEYNDDGSLHIPLLGADKWICTKLD